MVREKQIVRLEWLATDRVVKEVGKIGISIRLCFNSNLITPASSCTDHQCCSMTGTAVTMSTAWFDEWPLKLASRCTKGYSSLSRFQKHISLKRRGRVSLLFDAARQVWPVTQIMDFM